MKYHKRNIINSNIMKDITMNMNYIKISSLLMEFKKYGFNLSHIYSFFIMVHYFRVRCLDLFVGIHIYIFHASNIRFVIFLMPAC